MGEDRAPTPQVPTSLPSPKLWLDPPPPQEYCLELVGLAPPPAPFLSSSAPYVRFLRCAWVGDYPTESRGTETLHATATVTCCLYELQRQQRGAYRLTMIRAVARHQQWRRQNMLACPEYPHGHSCVFLHSKIFAFLPQNQRRPPSLPQPGYSPGRLPIPWFNCFGFI